MQARKTLLFEETRPWIKNSGDKDFNVPMGCFDGAEICELVGTFIQSNLTNIKNKEDVGLYRDDGLGIFKSISRPEIERKKKAILKVSKKCGLLIVLDTNLKTVDFLDVTFEKLEASPKYFKTTADINCQAISETSSSEEIFSKSIKIYSKALKENDFMDELKYLRNEEQQLENNEREKRKRKIIWFNPPYSKNVKTNVGKVFLKLLKKHFPASHVLHKIFNKNVVKISYSCIKYQLSYSSHNKSILNPRTTSFWCNCGEKESCLLYGECLTSQLVYRATVTNAAN